MKFGIAIFPTDYAISMTELAPAVEQLGFESLWVAEHSHIPASRLSAWPGGAELPKHYWHTMDPFLALTEAALASKELLIATGICLVVQRDPIHTAKQVASVDHVSNGRFLFGIGAGWNKEEMADHGTDFESRFKLMRERVEAMKAIWTQEEAEYHGELVDFGPMWCWPKPVQKPHPPVLLGGSGPNVLKRAVAYADGWMPNRGDDLGRIPQLQELAQAAGRGRLPVTTYPKADAAEIRRHADAGVERCIYYVPPDGRDQALTRLEELAALVKPFAV
ncbi:MAG: LLM class F420-dependent oxidoreductase [Chloroflexi bacterium]|nr:MAG: LLM class F420-dependent oxidoreductase [Chloroflexota bacterium]TMC69824.1 MAG: LLM class F420-dependent oxidoreductase [Chloroflexota bacterium]